MLTHRVFSSGPSSGRTSLQRGLSVVELLVGVAVGLFVVAGAAMLTATQLGENRRLLLETQIQQDLRATIDVISHELRRSGADTNTTDFVWTPGSGSATPAPLVAVSPDSSPGTDVSYNYRRTITATSDSGFKLVTGTVNKIQSRLPGAVGWQDLTDTRTVHITTFTVTPRFVDEPTPGTGLDRMPCPKLCTGGGTSCWPVMRVREYQIDIVAEAVADPTVKRTVRSIVRLRNDEVRMDAGGLCPA